MIVLRRRTGIILLLVHLALGASGCVINISDLDGDDGWDSNKVEVAASFSRFVPVQGQTALSLVATNGSVLVRGEAGIQGVSIEGRRWVRAHTRRDAQDHLPRLRVVVEEHPGEVSVKTEQPKDSGGRTYGVDYEITVPDDFFVQVCNGNGDVEISGIREDVVVENGNGNVILHSQWGSSWVSLGNGEIRSDVVLPSGGQVVHAAGNGGVRLTIQRSVSAEFAAHVGNGTISVNGLDFAHWTSGPGFAEGVLGDGEGLIDLSVGNGWIQVQGQ